MPVPICLSVPTVARRLGVHVCTLDGWISAGRGPIVTRIEGKVLVREDYLLRWLDSRASDAGQRAA